ncbi:uncharacterized protein L3040_005109 [Drepanopeziza brunnea f. sp. 'multigermtubi']|uniref:uncharacterized protein n=1 Tax=Drepanopeziza brunnea f. sp. 'multigermtubi' TaxID=698441 RepID=UPI00239A6CF8|nr:hypothetical protein L3040_005109 [Drepanopeziza brunnea f. sp. 'multigermtubi']
MASPDRPEHRQLDPYYQRQDIQHSTLAERLADLLPTIFPPRIRPDSSRPAAANGQSSTSNFLGGAKERQELRVFRQSHGEERRIGRQLSVGSQAEKQNRGTMGTVYQWHETKKHFALQKKFLSAKSFLATKTPGDEATPPAVTSQPDPFG